MANFDTHTQRFTFFFVCLEIVCLLMNAWRRKFRIFHSLWTVCGHVGGLFCVLCDWITHTKLFIIRLFFSCGSSMGTLNCFLMKIKGVPTLKSFPFIFHLSFYSVNGIELLLLFVCQFHDIAILFTSRFWKEVS